MIETGVSEHVFTVLENREVAEGIWRLLLQSSVAESLKPGQFMNLQVPGDGSHILRIPLSFAHADASEGTVELLYAVVGEGTRRLSRMSEGDASVLTGPCGRGWWLPDGEGRALLVAGGIGLPPVLAAARMLSEAGLSFDAVVGARTATMLPQAALDVLEKLAGTEGAITICTDDGSAGHKGFTTDVARRLAGERGYESAYTCGPNVMMAGVARICQDFGMACQVSMERMMGCGFGACSCCNVALAAGGYALCCQDGPVFDAKEVAW